jgi:hypothetical protein
MAEAARQSWAETDVIAEGGARRRATGGSLADATGSREAKGLWLVQEEQEEHAAAAAAVD